LRIKQVDEQRHTFAQFLTCLGDEFNRQHVVVFRCRDDVFKFNLRYRLTISRGNAGRAFLYLLAKRLNKCLPRSLGLQTSFLAALTYDLVVENRDVPKLAGESRFPIIQLSVYQHAESDTVVYINKEYILFVL